MDTRGLVNEYRAAHWLRVIQEHAQGEQRVKELCVERGFSLLKAEELREKVVQG
jgi:hypothetical protein